MFLTQPVLHTCVRAAVTLIALLAVAHAATPAFQSNLAATSQWLAVQQLSDGAIPFTSTAINPYFANLGAQGWTKDPSKYTLIEAWMHWYINHLNFPDQWGLNGTIYDYNLSGSVETSTGDADSTDAYAATFISLAWAYWSTGDSNARSYIRSIESDLDTVASVIVAMQQSDGLTWAKPNYHYKFLMDNCESYQGLSDAVSLFSALGALRARHILPLLAMRNTKNGSGLGEWRWVVERTFAWLNQFRRLRLRYEKRADMHKAFLSLACALICWNFLQDQSP